MLGGLRQMLGGVGVENAGEAVEHPELIHGTPDLALAVGQHHPVLSSLARARSVWSTKPLTKVSIFASGMRAA